MRYYEKTAPEQNGRIREEQLLKKVERITPSRTAPSFLRIVLLPVLISVALITLTAYAFKQDWIVALGWGAGLTLPIGYWRIRVWDDQPTDAIDRREYQDFPVAEPAEAPRIQPIITSGRPNQNQIKYGRFTYTEAAWRKWATILRSNQWRITRDIFAQVRLNDRPIFTNLTNNYNDLIAEMHRLGWTTEDKTQLSDTGIQWFQRWLPNASDPPPPTQ